MSNAPVTPAASPTVPGAILAGKYRVERILGQGGMGVVVEAKHIALDERVALKFLSPDFAAHPEASARFLREARNAVKIKSEHVARVTDVGTLEDGAPYMVMEFLEGRDLAGTLEKGGVLAIPDAVDYIIQGCEAIAEAHSQGIVHRDLKPANLFLSRRPDGSPIVKVLDFGISKSGSRVDNLTRTSASMGSALYMSPEQMSDTRKADHRTDVYALGISLYELLAGRQPFYADTLPALCAAVMTGEPAPLRDLRADVPEALAAVIRRAYARDVKDRFQSIGEMVVALAPWAPPRSAPTIERVARIAGVPIPEARSPSGSYPDHVPSSPPSQPREDAVTPSSPIEPAPATRSSAVLAAAPAAPLQQGGTNFIAPAVTVVPAPAPQSLLGTRPTVPLPMMDPTAEAPPPPAPAPPPPPPSNPNHIVPGHYTGPMSVRAAASFKQRASAIPPITGQPRSKGNLVAVVVITMLGLGGIATALVLRAMKARDAAIAETVTAPVESAPVVPASAAPTHGPTVTPAVDTAPKPDDAPKPIDTARPQETGSPRPGHPRGAPSARPTAAPSTDKKNDGNKQPPAPDLGKMY